MKRVLERISASKRTLLVLRKVQTQDQEELAVTLASYAAKWGEAQLKTAVTGAMSHLLSRAASKRHALFFAAVKALDARDGSLAFADSIACATSDRAAARHVAKMLAADGAIERPLHLLEKHTRDRSDRYLHLQEQSVLLRDGVVPAKVHVDSVASADGRILYHVSQSYPYHPLGYAIRTQYLMKALQQAGWDPQVVARFGYPADRLDFAEASLPITDEVIDGISYHFTPDQEGIRGKEVQEQHGLLVASLLEQAKKLRPALIHSASNHVVGMAGAQVAKSLGVPSVYEMRGLWHMSRAAKQPAYQDSEHYRMVEGLEVQAAHESDHVFAITEAIRKLLIDAGVSAAKISLLPNAVDSEQFRPCVRHAGLEKTLGLQGKVVIGFLGSMKAYEGLDDLLRAIALIRKEVGDSVRLLMVGDGAAQEGLTKQAEELGLSNKVIFTGRVSHEEVGDYYSLMDVLCYPRKSVAVCEFISPLKPFEAMAQEKAVVVSSVAALAEIALHEKTGLVHRKGNVEDLAACLRRLIDDAELRSRLGKNARAWVSEQRTWQRNAAHVVSVYDRLLGVG